MSLAVLATALRRDAYGSFAYVKLKKDAGTVNFTVEKDGTQDGNADRTIDSARAARCGSPRAPPMS
ncbi:pullulanase-associated domain-containing protein [Streptomyces sp. NPDC054940]